MGIACAASIVSFAGNNVRSTHSATPARPPPSTSSAPVAQTCREHQQVVVVVPSPSHMIDTALGEVERGRACLLYFADEDANVVK